MRVKLFIQENIRCMNIYRTKDDNSIPSFILPCYRILLYKLLVLHYVMVINNTICLNIMFIKTLQYNTI